MTEKRFWYDFEDCNGAKIIDFKKDKEYPLETIGNFRDIEELLNSLNDENEELKQENQSWLKTASHFDCVAHKDRDYAKRMHKENKELKEELVKFQKWEKHIRDVKREDLDRVFKMSIYEIAEAFEYYKKRIKELEE